MLTVIREEYVMNSESAFFVEIHLKFAIVKKIGYLKPLFQKTEHV